VDHSISLKEFKRMTLEVL